MRAYFEVFDLRSGNVVASFPHEDDAWEMLRQAAIELGPEEIAEHSLVHVQDDRSSLVAIDDDRLRRVMGEIEHSEVSA